MAEQEQGWMFGLLFRYPQGQVSFLPTVVALSALVCHYLMFLPFRGDGEKNFMCFPTRKGTAPSFSFDHECFEMRLVDESYWSETGSDLDDDQGGKIQAAASMGIIATIGAAYAFMTLASASCFTLRGRGLLTVFIVQICSAVFTMLSIFCFMLVNQCTDENKLDATATSGLRLDLDLDSDSDSALPLDSDSDVDLISCNRQRPRLADGGVAAVFASMFHVAGCVTVFLYRREAIRQQNASPLPKHEAAPLRPEGFFGAQSAGAADDQANNR